MSFDRQLAERTIHSRDRDAALFFAGRKKEIEAFEWALREAGEFDSAAFRLYQGPPGCGKTSLANHLKEQYADEVLFVPCEPADFKNKPALLKRMREFALVQKGAAERLGGATIKTAAEYFKLGTLSEAVRDVMERASLEKRAVVLHLDEAHGRVNAGYPGVDETLLDLHTVGLGVPCVVLLTGLGHTRKTVTSIKGLTRLARNATHDIGGLSETDCARSTQDMLDALNAAGPASVRNRLANLTGELAHEWPAHLHGAQAALCGEIIRVGGDLRDVRADTVRRQSDAMRHDYYERRLDDHPAFGLDRPMTQRILVDVARRPPRSLIELGLACRKAIDRTGRAEGLATYGLTPKIMADALLEKGIVEDTGRTIAPSIPSMVDWAADDLGIKPPRRKAAAGFAR